jgi:hypothetical protein
MTGNRTAHTSNTPAGAAAITAMWAVVALGLPNTSPAQATATGARCAHPAPIENRLDPMVPDVTLMIRSDVDLVSVAARLSRLYGVRLSGLRIIHALRVKSVTAELVDKLRCEPGVELVSYSVRTSTD